MAEVRRPFVAHLFGFTKESPAVSKFSEKFAHGSSSAITVYNGSACCQIHPALRSPTPNKYILHSSPTFDSRVPRAASPSPMVGLGIYASHPMTSPRRLSLVGSPTPSPRATPTRSRSIDSNRTSLYSYCSSPPVPQFRSNLYYAKELAAPPATIPRHSAVFKAVHPPKG